MLSVCIVGNSGNLLSQELGDKIDSCDDVIRIQKFKREGFEKHVGSKLTIASLSLVDVPQMKDFIEYGNIDINTSQSVGNRKYIYRYSRVANKLLGVYYLKNIPTNCESTPNYYSRRSSEAKLT